MRRRGRSRTHLSLKTALSQRESAGIAAHTTFAAEMSARVGRVRGDCLSRLRPAQRRATS
jgi:hypothetical protein